MLTQKMKVCKTKKTSTAHKSLQPSFNQSFDLKMKDSYLPHSFLTVQLRQAREFPARGEVKEDLD